MNKIVADYEALLERALLIVLGPPYFEGVYDTSFVRLSIDGAKATLRWPMASADGWDGDCSASLEVSVCSFPADLLGLSEEGLRAWKEGKRAEFERSKEVMAGRVWTGQSWYGGGWRR